MTTITKTKYHTELYAKACKSPRDGYEYGNVFIQDVSTECVEELDRAFGNSSNLAGTEHIFCQPTLENLVENRLNKVLFFSDETQKALLDACEFAGNSGGYIIFRA